MKLIQCTTAWILSALTNLQSPHRVLWMEALEEASVDARLSRLVSGRLP